ncbi:MAG: hypothetical protein O3B25_14935, partial [Verrucomicrobia bacterium]|nr:hypothetical protein [Verrucomicrobiota bacterium]
MGLPFRDSYGVLAIRQVAKCIKIILAVDEVGVVLHLIYEVYPANLSLPESSKGIFSVSYSI